MYRTGSTKAKLGWSRLQSKRGVTDVVLMMGIALAMAILLIGGASLVSKFVQAQAQSSPKFVATELTTLINTVQAAPETVTFDYYTDVTQDGYPIIGSLEIDDSKNLLCVAAKTEGEMFGSIADQAAVGAGFGAIGFTSNRVRSAVSARAARTATVDNALFGKFSKIGLSKSTLSRITGGGEDSQLARKFLRNEELSAADREGLRKYFTSKEGYELSMAREQVKDDPLLKQALTSIDKTEETKAQGLWVRIKAKFPWTQANKESRYGQRAETYIARQAEKPSTAEMVAGKVVKVAKTPASLAKTTLKAGSGLILAGVFAGANYLLTGGDWTTTIVTFAQMTIMNYMPKLLEWIVGKLVERFGVRLVTVIPPSVAAATGAKLGLEACKDLGSNPVTAAAAPPFCVAGAIAKAAEVITNVAFAIYNAIAMDLALTQIHSAASHQASIEHNAIACENFVAPKKVLLTPPNCAPGIKYGHTFTQLHDVTRASFYGSAITLWAATGWAAANSWVPSAATIPAYQAYIGLTAGLVAAYSPFIYTVVKDPTGLIPQSGCSSDFSPQDWESIIMDKMEPTSCDQKYLRQDCPNWFLSQPGISSTESKISGYGFEILLNGGPVCASLALTGIAGALCDAARVTTAMAIFLDKPSEIFAFFMHTDEVGLQKTLILNKTAPEFPDLPGEFSNNLGFWYAEFPYVLEFTKVYVNGSSNSNRNPPLIIRKV